MKIEVITAAECQDRVLLLFEGEAPSEQDSQVDDYLRSNNLEPKRQYTENRDGKDYRVYYFGQCYIGAHMDQLTALADDPN
jgi:hypothetical protein